MLEAGFNGKGDGLVVVFHVVEFLISRLQLAEDMLRFLWRWLRDINLLEAAYHAF